MESGIYRFYNMMNGKSYVGRSKDLKHRKREHLTLLRKGIEPCPKLNRAWKKYGESAFAYEVLCYCGEEELLAKEREYIALYDSFNNGYNCTAGGDGILGFRHTEDAKRKIGDFFRGRKLSPEHIKKIGEWQKGKRLSDEHKEALRAAWTPDRKIKFSESRSGSSNPNFGRCGKDACNKRPIVASTGEKFDTLREAAKWCGLKTTGNISSCCSGRRLIAGKHPKTGEILSWQYADET